VCLGLEDREQMSQESESEVGRRIRAVREGQGLSMRALAERCGLSVNAISRIERGETSPTLSSLHQIATGLGLRLGEFFREESEQSAVLVRATERGWFRESDLLVENLGAGLEDQRLEPFLVTVEGVGGGASKLVGHPGEEFVHCLEGEVEYRVGDRLYRLQPGDSLLFNASLLHSFRGTTPQPARILLVFNSDRPGQQVRWPHLDV